MNDLCLKMHTEWQIDKISPKWVCLIIAQNHTGSIICLSSDAIKVSFITKHSTKYSQKETHFYLLLPSLQRFGRLGEHVFCFHVPVFLLPSLTNILQQQTNLTSPLKPIIVIRKGTNLKRWLVLSTEQSILHFYRSTAEQFKVNRVTHSVVMLWNSTLKL